MKKISVIAAIVLIISAVIFFFISSQERSGKLDDFAKCLKDRGAVFYGAFWCSHCQNQKRLFGSSAKYLPYVECSTPDGKDQLQACKDKQIQGYPTWEFANSATASGELTLGQLSEKTSCPLPK